MSVIRVVYAALLLIFTIWSTTIHCQVTRSRKKGLVIPYWPRHMCGDFDAFETVSWWYNYHTYKQVYDQVPYWCTCEDGFPPKNKSICFPSDPHEIAFVPQVYGVEGYGPRPIGQDDPPIPEWEWQFLGFNEPNQADQSDIPPEVAALEYKKLQDMYPDKVMISPATGHADVEWFDEFMQHCTNLDCRIDYIATHLYTGTVDERMQTLKEYSQRYGGKQIWLTEFAVNKEDNVDKIVEFIEEFLPRLEFANYIHKYSWFYTRYYEDHDHSDPWFWLDSNNSLMKENKSELTKVGKAYDKPWHMEEYRPKIID